MFLSGLKAFVDREYPGGVKNQDDWPKIMLRWGLDGQVQRDWEEALDMVKQNH